jgi:hypothetical protein
MGASASAKTNAEADNGLADAMSQHTDLGRLGTQRILDDLFGSSSVYFAPPLERFEKGSCAACGDWRGKSGELSHGKTTLMKSQRQHRDRFASTAGVEYRCV